MLWLIRNDLTNACCGVVFTTRQAALKYIDGFGPGWTVFPAYPFTEADVAEIVESNVKR